MINLPQIISHRGASAYAPENTIVAFKKAKLLGASMVEFDVMLSADQIPVVIHDENIKRTTDSKGRVIDFSLEQLQTFDAGRWFARKYKGEQIPSFKMVLETLNTLQMCANVELKPNAGYETETIIQVLSDINHYWQEGSPPLLISSFDFKTLEMVRSFAPEQPLGLLLHQWQDDWIDKAAQLACFSIHLNHRILTQKRIDEIKAQGYKVLAYTVNRARRAKKLISMGVDSIFSDYPNLLL